MGVVGESSKWSSNDQCYRCQGFGHIASQCPTKRPQLYVEGIEDAVVLEEEYVPTEEASDEESENEEHRVSFLRFAPYHHGESEIHVSAGEVPRLMVVRCALTLQEGTDDWRRTAIF